MHHIDFVLHGEMTMLTQHKKTCWHVISKNTITRGTQNKNYDMMHNNGKTVSLFDVPPNERNNHQPNKNSKNELPELNETNQRGRINTLKTIAPWIPDHHRQMRQTNKWVAKHELSLAHSNKKLYYDMKHFCCSVNETSHKQKTSIEKKNHQPTTTQRHNYPNYTNKIKEA